MQKGTGNITIDATGMSDDVSIAVSSNQVTVSGNMVTIHPTNDLAASTAFDVTVPASAFKDLADNNFAGITTAGTWTSPPPATSTVTAPTLTGFTGNKLLGGALRRYRGPDSPLVCAILPARTCWGAATRGRRWQARRPPVSLRDYSFPWIPEDPA